MTDHQHDITEEDARRVVRERLPVQSVAELHEFPFRTHGDLVQAHRSGRVRIECRPEPHAIPVFGSAALVAAERAVLSAPFLAALGCLIAGLTLERHALLWGVPLAALSSLIVRPGRSFALQAVLAVAAAGALGQLDLPDLLTVTGACWAPCALLLLRQFVQRLMLLEAVVVSEEIFLWHYLRGCVKVRPRH